MLFCVGMELSPVIKSEHKSNECICHLHFRAAVSYHKRSTTFTLQDAEINQGV